MISLILVKLLKRSYNFILETYAENYWVSKAHSPDLANGINKEPQSSGDRIASQESKGELCGAKVCKSYKVLQRLSESISLELL